MKKRTVLKGLLTLTACLLVAVSVLGWAYLLLPETAATEGNPTLTDVRGRFFLGTEALNDPVRVTNASGNYYQPSSYVYLGGTSDAPILFRVLDADADNAGNAGAIFLFSEDTLAWGEEEYTLLDEEIDWREWNYENYYQYSTMYRYDRQESVFRAAYRTSSGKSQSELPAPLDYLRPITKEDDDGAMQGLYGYDESSSYTWFAPLPEEYTPHMQYSKILNGERVFPLSVWEIANYVGDYNGAPGLASSDGMPWWTRTSLSDEGGNLVGVVKSDGAVEATGVFTGGIGGRYATNLETEHIAFTYRIGEYGGAPVYKLALTHPLYRGEIENPFAARVKNVQGRTLTVEYDNAVYNSTSRYESVTARNCISVMITDKESGEVTYYGVIDEPYPVGTNTYGDGIVTQRPRTVRFDLPADFDRERDRVSVFLERRAGEAGMAFISNVVTLDCVHSVGEAAHCGGPALCGDCGERYGEPDPDVHRTYGEYVFDEETLTHRRYCTICEELVLEEPCSFGATCLSPCVCGSLAGIGDAQHAYDERGICRLDPSHTQPFVGDGDYFQDIEISNEGQFLSFAKYVNRGGRANVVALLADLDFTGLDFIPVGTETVALDALSIQGNKHTISGITHSDPDGISAIFANVKGTFFGGLTVENCSFEGRIAAVLIGVGDRVTGSRAMTVLDCTVKGEEIAGALIGHATGCALRATGAYNVTDGEGDCLPFVGAGERATTSTSWSMAEETNVEAREWSAEDIASGALAFDMAGLIDGAGARVSQILGTDPYPTFRMGVSGGYNEPVTPVYGTTTCDGIPVYFNDPARKESVEAHTYTAPAGESVQFIWDDFFDNRCTVPALCGVCGHEGRVDATVNEYFYFSSSDHIDAIIRADYTPRVTLGEKTYTGETRVFFTTTLESVIGMTAREVTFDGFGVSPDDLMDNHWLLGPDDGVPSAFYQYEAYFLDEEGQRLGENGDGANAIHVGTYDLVVEGCAEFIGQSVTYEDVLVIKPLPVTVTPKDVFRPYEKGVVSFDAAYESDWEYAEYFLAITLGDASSDAVGAYGLPVRVESVGADCALSDLLLTLTRDSVRGAILPSQREELTDVTYPEAVEYGEAIPTPTPEAFGCDPAGAFSFAWYRLPHNAWEQTRVAVEAPHEAGDYVLAVLADPREGYALATYYEHAFTVTPRVPTMTVVTPEGVTLLPPANEWENPQCTLMSGQNLSLALGNLAAGETAESAHLTWEMELDWSEIDAIPTEPTADGKPYHIVFRVYCDPPAGINANYETGLFISVDVYVLPGTGIAPAPTVTLPALSATVNDLLTSDAEHTFGLTVSWEYEADPLYPEDAGYSRYILELYDGEGTLLDDAVAENSTYFGETYGTHTFYVDRAGDYTVKVIRGSYFDYSVREEQEAFDVTATLACNGEGVDTIGEMGIYSLTVSVNGEAQTHAFTVRKTVVMYLKSCEFNLSDAILPFQKELVVTTADSTLAFGHELVRVNCVVEDYDGQVEVESITVRDTRSGADVSDLYYVENYVSDWSHTDGGYNVCHIFDNACDDTCEHCDYTRAAAHTVGERATCMRGAICATCGTVCTDPDPRFHVTDASVAYPNPLSDDAHDLLCLACGGVRSTHLHEADAAANCQRGALCTACGWIFGEKDPERHASEVIEYLPDGEDATRHVGKHVCCAHTFTEEHRGGNATCTARAACEACGERYGETNPSVHTGTATYTHTETDHTATWSCCSAVVTEKHAGGTATCTSGAICTGCKTVYGAPDPDAHTSTETKLVVGATNASVHEERHVCCDGLIRSEYHTGGTADCAHAATCEVCHAEYGVKNPDKHASDGTETVPSEINPLFHDVRRVCCGEILSTEAHAGGQATCTHGTVCDACSVDYGTPLGHTYSGACDAVCDTCNARTRAQAFHTDADANALCDVCGATLEAPAPVEPEPDADGGESTDEAVDTVLTVVGFSAAGVTVAATGGFSLWWFALQKKSWLDLIKPFLA